MRPRFEVAVTVPPGDVLHRIDERLAEPACRVVGSHVDQHVNLYVEPGLRHYWSPHLQLELSPQGRGTHLHGLFGPHPNVWTLFMALYAVTAFFGLIGLTFGVSQLGLDQDPWALWVVPAAAALGGAFYAVALMGQRLAHEQMVMLRGFLEECLPTADLPTADLPTADPAPQR
jgi:hypothetical protein